LPDFGAVQPLGNPKGANWDTGRRHTAKSRRFVSNFVDHTLAHLPAGPSESSNRVLRRETVNSREKLSRPSVPCPTEQDPAQRKSDRSICGFKRRCPGDYRVPAKSRNSNRLNPRVPENHTTSQKRRADDRLSPQGAETTIHRAPQ